ncbi:hypothetical protein ZIOFF_059981 [Zingiber officinale]|uniref:NHL repeat-containing protein n=1 Tax=Zingiber officinale TaxID=94328 RepID=A0A8J5FA57_ZINOF|nr:hypothetical protein ZIOFF_059981 [Zingiber officinale]
MDRSVLFLFVVFLIVSSTPASYAAAFLDSKTQGAIVKHLSHVLKWTKSAPKTTQHDGDVVDFESGYFVETLVEGGKLGVLPHTIRVISSLELYFGAMLSETFVETITFLFISVKMRHMLVFFGIVIWVYKNGVADSRARLVAGSFQGYSGHVDGKPADARFYHPKGVTMDDKGNVYVADTSNLAIRKISETGVTTIAGGKSNLAGYRDGPSDDAKFSSDFDVVYVGRTCSLIVVDRGNAALRQISLQQEDCEYQDTSVSTPDIIMVIGAIFAGYISCLFQYGFGPFISQKNQVSESVQHMHKSHEKPALVVESIKEEPGAGWPSLGRLLVDLSKFAFEGIGNMLLNIFPFNLGRKTGLSPLKDHLIMPEDKTEPQLVQKQKSTPPMPETLHEPNVTSNATPKLQKSNKIPKFKDPSQPSKHRSSKRPDYSSFYGSAEDFQTSKDRARPRHRDKSSEVLYGAVGTEAKSADMKSTNYSDPKYDHYNIRSKYGQDNTFRY